MGPERWRHIEQLYHDALERNMAQRPGFLDQACVGDEELRREVESLLAQNEEGDGFLEARAMDLAAKELARESSSPEDRPSEHRAVAIKPANA